MGPFRGREATTRLLATKQQCSRAQGLTGSIACMESMRCDPLRLAAGVVPRLLPAQQARIIREHRLAINFIVRDGEGFLERNVARLASLGRRFREYRIFYVENDSKDNTRTVLRRLAQEYPSFRGLMLDGLGNESHALCPARMQEMNCERRLTLLAYLRQRALELVQTSWAHWTALLSVDIDFLTFTADQYVGAFVTGVLHNASAVFGMSVCASSTAISGVRP